MQKNVIITGTSSGLGLSTAVTLAAEGYKVYATMRNLDKRAALDRAAAAAGVAVELLTLDVTDERSVQAAVASVVAQDGRVDVLINNAGAGFAKHIEQASEADMIWVTDVNYFGVVRCTQAVVPHMREAGAGHIVNVTSVGALVGQPFNELYCGAKFAVEGFTEALATVLPEFGIRLTLVEPGGIASEFATSATKATIGEAGLPDDAYAPIFGRYLAGFQTRERDGADSPSQTPDEVAEVLNNVLKNPSPPLRIRTSAWAEALCAFKTEADPDGLKQTADVVERFL